MALFRAEVKPISRGKNHNAVAAAAYRAGEKLTDTNTYNPDRTTHDFSKKSDILHKNIILPSELAEAGFSIARQDLWSKVEENEVTKKDQKLKANARVAREWLLALPHELSDEENITLAEEFARKMANDLGVIADCCIHDPKLKSQAPTPKPTGNTADKEPVVEDDRNIHAHIMFTTRKAQLNAADELIFTDKADCELDGTARKKKGLVKETDYIKEVRSAWAGMVNKRLVAHGIKEVSPISYKDRNLDILPQIHAGKDPLTEEKRIYNDAITERNELVFESRVDTLEKLANRADKITGITDNITARNGKLSGHTSKRAEYSERQTQESKRRVTNPTRPTAADPFDDAIRASTARRERASTELIEQQRQFNRASERTVEEFRRTDGLPVKFFKQREHLVARHVRRGETVKGQLINKVLQRHKPENHVQWAWRESSDDPEHTHKFDQRQLEALDAFANKHELERVSDEDIHELRERRHRLRRDNNFFKNNAEIFDLVRDPKFEREQYNARTLSEAQQDVSIDEHYPSIKAVLETSEKAIEEPPMIRNVPRF